MRFIHSSDLQIGKTFGRFEPEAAALLRDARHAVVRTLGELAVGHGATAVLLAGDIYDKQQMSQVSLAKPIEAMWAFPGITWHLMPGNHDHVRESGLWERLARMQLPETIRLHTRPGPVSIAKEDDTPAYLLPAPVRHVGCIDDLSSYMDGAATPDGSIRVGMAHGSIQGFGSDGDATNLIAPMRAEHAGLRYLAMGDWHRQTKINERVWYAGTPEPDCFKRPPDAAGTLCNGGAALLVDVSGPRAVPVVTPIETGRYRWHAIEKTLLDDSQVALLEAELRAVEPDLSRVVIQLRIEGTLSLSGRATLEKRVFQQVRAAMCAMQVGDGLLLEPTEEDLNAIDRAGFVRVAADRLKAAASSTNTQQAHLASLALRRLFVEQTRLAGEP
jgi:DNA repair exonuclease SbcCD nuclease subunit